MDIVGYVNKLSSVGRYLLLTVLVLNLMSVSFASGNLGSALKQLCTMSQQFLGITVMVLIVLAGVVYAIGQVMGAETRARAAVWATAMLTGAVIGIIIYIVTPVLVSTLTTGTGVTVSGTGNPCA